MMNFKEQRRPKYAARRSLPTFPAHGTMRALARLAAAAAQAPSRCGVASDASLAMCSRMKRHLAGVQGWRATAIANDVSPASDCRQTRSFGTSAAFAVSHSPRREAATGAGAGGPPTDNMTEIHKNRPTGDKYEAHLAETVKNVKLLSLASLAATVCGTPLLLELASPDMLPQAKLTVSLVVDSFGTFTTALLQWFVSPYVLTMRVEKATRDGGDGGDGSGPKEDTVVVEKLTLFASRFEDRFPVSAMIEAETTRPLVTWQANGHYHYVEMGNVPKSLYDLLHLERFDDQARALRHAKENKDDEDDED